MSGIPDVGRMEMTPPIIRHLLYGGTMLAIFLIDFLTPRDIAVGVLYILPILLSLWDPRKSASRILAVVASLLIGIDYMFSPLGGEGWQSLGNRLLALLAVWTAMAFVEERRKAEQMREQSVVLARERALEEARTLRGLLPICASCKKIRNDGGYWEQIEIYIRDRSEAEFSHGLCPECLERLYPKTSEKDGEIRGTA
jgi:hypothetical protein